MTQGEASDATVRTSSDAATEGSSEAAIRRAGRQLIFTLYGALRGSDVKVDPSLEVTDLQLRDAVGAR